MKLMELYDSIEDPLDNKENLLELVRIGFSNNKDNLYERLKNINVIKDKSNIVNKEDERKFVEKYNKIWKQNHPDKNNLKEEEINENWMKEQGEQYPVFYHIKSRNIYNKTKEEEELKKTRHRLYINIDLNNIYKFSEIFMKKCEEKNLPYYFKISVVPRNDTFIIYSNTYFLEKYIEILREIKMENPDIVNTTHKPPILTGVIDKWIGYGSEPAREKNSFNMIRCECIQKAIRKGAIETLNINKDEKIKYHGKTISFKEYIAKAITKNIIKTQTRILNRDFSKEEPELYKKVLENIDTIFECYINADYKKIRKNPIRVDYEYKNGTNRCIKVDSLDINSSLEDVFLELVEKSKIVEERIRKNIKEAYEAKGIDTKKTCFDDDIVENMRQYDKLVEEVAKKKSNKKQEEKTPKKDKLDEFLEDSEKAMPIWKFQQSQEKYEKQGKTTQKKDIYDKLLENSETAIPIWESQKNSEKQKRLEAEYRGLQDNPKSNNHELEEMFAPKEQAIPMWKFQNDSEKRKRLEAEYRDLQDNPKSNNYELEEMFAPEERAIPIWEAEKNAEKWKNEDSYKNFKNSRM